MRRPLPLLLSLALFAANAPAVSAQGSLYLFWDQCYSAGGTVSKSFACDANTGPALAMFASVVIPADIPQFAAASVVVDVVVSESPLPPWWQTATGQCRAGAISASYYGPMLDPSNCPTIWMGVQPYSVFVVQQGLRGPNTLRINTGAAVPAGSELALVADGAELVVARIAISRSKTTGSGSCGGCVNTACFKYEESKLQQPAGQGDYTISQGWLYNYVYLTGTSPGLAPSNVLDPCEVPALNRTWGAIKTLYR